MAYYLKSQQGWRGAPKKTKNAQLWPGNQGWVPRGSVQYARGADAWGGINGARLQPQGGARNTEVYQLAESAKTSLLESASAAVVLLVGSRSTKDFSHSPRRHGRRSVCCVQPALPPRRPSLIYREYSFQARATLTNRNSMVSKS
jgi:hypothetical protein